jgi:signal recognition particle subunit SRP54
MNHFLYPNVKTRFDLDDLGQQLKQMQKMGGISDMLNLLPGMSKAQQAQLEKANVDDRMIVRQLAILSSDRKSVV